MTKVDFLIVFVAKYLYLVIIVAAIAAILVYKKTFVVGSVLKLILISFPLAFISARILSFFIYTSRPFVVENVEPLIPHAADNGFPSDHTLLVMTISAVVLIYNRKVGIILLILSAIVGISRVFAKVHTPIDILGSTIIAFSSVAATRIILERIRPLGLLLDKILSKLKI